VRSLLTKLYRSTQQAMTKPVTAQATGTIARLLMLLNMTGLLDLAGRLRVRI
jgi:hypothetical protein